MEREWLERELEAGRSIESIAREVGKHGSTVAYWVRKHDLQSEHAERHVSRGAPDRELLAVLAEEGCTIKEIAERIERSPTTVRHWLARYDLATHRQQSHAGVVIEGEVHRRCRHHGLTRYVRSSAGHLRCATCRQQRVSERRRQIKRTLVEEAGGRCSICGYKMYPGALQFHHLDRATKEFHLSLHGISRGIARVRAEAQKCVLLCANCHAEVEGGVTRIARPE